MVKNIELQYYLGGCDNKKVEKIINVLMKLYKLVTNAPTLG